MDTNSVETKKTEEVKVKVEQVGKKNPANEKEFRLPKNYRPMSVSRQKLDAEPIEGYHLHWFRGNPANIQRALQAGYTFVEKGEVSLNDFDIAGDGSSDQGSDLGSRVSVISGDDLGGRQPSRLYLMKVPQELYDYSQSLKREELDSTVAALKGGQVGIDRPENASDIGKSYVKQANVKGFNMLTRKH